MTPANGIGAKRNAPPRYWPDAIAKRDAEGACRVCGKPNPEAAHLSGREHDPVRPCPLDCTDGYRDDDYSGERVLCDACKGTGLVRYVRPESIVPLCGPATDPKTCHARQEAGEIDLIPRLSNDEAACMVADVGLQRAYQSLSGEGRGPNSLETQRLREAA